LKRAHRAQRPEPENGPGKRDRILEGAVEAFAAKGFHRTTVRDVAQAAGVADGTIYLYFGSKNEILATIFETALERFWERGRAFLEQDEDPLGQLDRLVHLHLTFMGEDRRLAAVFQVDLRHSFRFLGEVSREVLRGHLERVQSIIRRGQDSGVFATEPDAVTAAHMVFGVLDQMVTSWVLSRRNYRLESQIPAVQRFLRQALAAPA
jgi:TetR/AcrR family fatty acid metabolism transcriptional regulator